MLAKTKKSPNPIDRHIGSRVRMRRLMLGMSQEKLGDALGLTFQQVQKYEKGTNRIGGSRLDQIAKILSVPVAFLFEGNPDSAPKGTNPQELVAWQAILATNDGQRLVKAFAALATKPRRVVVDLIEAMAADG
jgi:transcriptional regulator with XRE-family HTH domain